MEVVNTGVDVVIDQDLVAKVVQAAKDLEEKGYAVVRGVLTDTECTESLNGMWTCLEKATDQKIHRDANFSGMKATELLPHQHGILLSYRVNHAPPCRSVRNDFFYYYRNEWICL